MRKIATIISFWALAFSLPSFAAHKKSTPAGVPAGTAPAHEAAESGDASPKAHAHGAAGESMLPVVWSPKLGGDEVSEVRAEDALHSAAGEDMHASGEAPKDEAAASAGTDGAASSRSLRVAMVAVALAAAAAPS